MLKKIKRKLSQVRDSVLYATKDGYDAAKFWERQHRKFNSSFRTVASGDSDEFDRYPKQKELLLNFLKEEHVALSGTQCVEFGCGNGYWGKVLLESGAKSYTGLDVSQAAVHHCKKTIPNASFQRVNLGVDDFSSDSSADIALSIDVTQHVVEKQKLKKYLETMEKSVRKGGHIVMTSYIGFGDRASGDSEKVSVLGVIKLTKFNFVHFWDVPTLEASLSCCRLIRTVPFWDKSLLLFVKES